MTKDELTLEIQVIAREVFNKPELIISDSMCASDIDTWTSLSFMQLITLIEEKYCFKFKMMELIRLQTMGAIIDAVHIHMM